MQVTCATDNHAGEADSIDDHVTYQCQHPAGVPKHAESHIGQKGLV